MPNSSWVSWWRRCARQRRPTGASVIALPCDTITLMTTPRRIYLTGLLGSGKSTVAPLIAARLGWSWVDLDGEIERRENATIAALFERGEASFRAAETSALAAVSQSEPMVVATGGGVVI